MTGCDRIGEQSPPTEIANHGELCVEQRGMMPGLASAFGRIVQHPFCVVHNFGKGASL
jgi:hypothetical protein